MTSPLVEKVTTWFKNSFLVEQQDNNIVASDPATRALEKTVWYGGQWPTKSQGHGLKGYCITKQVSKYAYARGERGPRGPSLPGTPADGDMAGLAGRVDVAEDQQRSSSSPFDS